MGVFIIRTKTLDYKYMDYEPFKTFLTKFEKLDKADDIWGDIYIDLERCCYGENKPFDIDRYYFSNPGINLSYYKLHGEDTENERFLIGLELDFSFDPCFGEIISSGLEAIEKKSKHIYVPKVEEIQLLYRVTHKSAKFEIITITREKNAIKEISISLLSIIVTLFAKGW